MIKNLRNRRVRYWATTAVAISGLGITLTTASAQVACVTGLNPGACTVASGVTIASDVQTNGFLHTIGNAGVIDLFAQTLGANSSITNSGTITLFSQTTGVNSPINNSGIISGSVQTFNMNSAITNTGTIESFVQTFGMNSGITNSGTIDAFVITNGIGSAIENTGTINDAVTTNGFGAALTNYGTITGSAMTSGVGSNVLNFGTINGNVLTTGDNSSIVNTGTIDGSVTMSGLNPTLTLQGGSMIGGPIDLMGGGLRTLNVGPGLNADLTFVNAPTVINGTAFVMPSATQVVAVDRTGFTASDIAMGDLTSAIFEAVNDNVGTGFNQSGVTVSTQGAISNAWLRGFGGASEFKQGGALADVDHEFAGIIGGFDNGVFGAFGGAAFSDLDVQFGAQSTDVNSAFAGAYWKAHLGRSDLNLAFAVGTANHETQRRVTNNIVPGGVETGVADFDGWFIAPSATLSTPTEIGARSATSSLRLNYSALFLDSYTEVGTTTPLTVSDRTAHQVNARAQIAFPTVFSGDSGSQTSLELSAGLDGQFSLGGNDVSATLAATPIAFEANAENHIAGFLGASFSHTGANGLATVSAFAEFQTDVDSSRKLSAGLNASWNF